MDNNPPEVVAVYANSTAWAPTFRNALEDQHEGSAVLGFETDGVKPEAGQFREHVLPWTNVNQISIQFNEDVSVQQDDLTITGVNRASYPATAFIYDATTFVATWTLDAPVDNDVLTLRLEGTSATGVTDLAGNPLHGNCEDEDTSGGGGSSGSPARDYCEAVPVLPGDVTRDGRVNALDLGDARARLNSTTTNPGESRARYSVFADVNGDGRINALDLGLIRVHLNNTLPDSSASPMDAALGG